MQVLVNALLNVLKHHVTLCTLLFFLLACTIVPLLQWYPLTLISHALSQALPSSPELSHDRI